VGGLIRIGGGWWEEGLGGLRPREAVRGLIGQLTPFRLKLGSGLGTIGRVFSVDWSAKLFLWLLALRVFLETLVSSTVEARRELNQRLGGGDRTEGVSSSAGSIKINL